MMSFPESLEWIRELASGLTAVAQGARRAAASPGPEAPSSSSGRPPTMHRILRDRELGNRRLTWQSLPKDHFDALNQEMHGVPSIVASLRTAALARDQFSMNNAFNQLALKCREDPAPCASVIECGGVEVMKAILQSPAELLFKESQSDIHGTLAKTRLYCVTILRDLCYSSQSLTECLGDDIGLLIFLFSLMSDKTTFENAVSLTEELLTFREQTFDLSIVPDFMDLVHSLNSRQLAVFCRVLTLAAFEPDEKLNNFTSKSLKALKAEVVAADPTKPPVYRRPLLLSPPHADRNHALLLAIPDFVPRLVLLLGVKNVPSTAVTTQIMAQSGEILSMLCAVDDDVYDWDDLEADHSMPAFLMQEGVPRLQYTLKALNLASRQVEILFVLSGLLASKRKVDVQAILGRSGLVGALSHLWSRLDWENEESHAHYRIHGPGCDCNPESALKIQFLRLVHHFVDVYDEDSLERRRLLLTAEEYIQHIGAPPREYDGLRCPSGSPGLLSEILRVLQEQPATSQYRFWLASCVESFLRGAQAADQRFILRSSGLLEHVLDQIMCAVDASSHLLSCLQSNFDLLGELIKFSRTAFIALNELLSHAQFGVFVSIMTRNLVDSNVFIRSVVLSVNSFANEPEPADMLESERAYDVSTCKLAAFLASQRARLLRDLMMVVTVQDINQENICCLNTALLLFIFARRRKGLPALLEEVGKAEAEERLERRPIEENFRTLLSFWRAYYTQRGRDCLLLAYSSRVPFREWRSAVDELMGVGDKAGALLASSTCGRAPHAQPSPRTS